MRRGQETRADLTRRRVSARRRSLKPPSSMGNLVWILALLPIVLVVLPLLGTLGMMATRGPVRGHDAHEREHDDGHVDIGLI
jgi:hypothetical protein